MEQNHLHSIASSLFDAMDDSTWKDQSLDAIEGAVQRLLAQLGTTLLEDFLLPKRIADLEQQVDDGHLFCPDCGGCWRLHKRQQHRHLKSLFAGRVRLTRSQYVCRSCQHYRCVADEGLQLPAHQMTPRLATLTALCGASWSYPLGAAFLNFLLGVEIADKSVELVTKDARLAPAELAPQALAKPPGVVTADGVLIHGRKKDSWLEMKVASFFSHVVEVSDSRRAVQDASFVASAVQEWRDFVGAVTQEAKRRGLSGWESVEFVSDGAEGIWQLQEMIFPNAQRRLDLYHSKCKIGERLKQAYAGSAKKKSIEEAVQGYFEKGLVKESIAYLKKRTPREADKKKAAQKLIGYLERHQGRIANYQAVQAAGGCVSSGLTEKANDLLVCRRMKEGTMHWTRAGAAPVLQRRQHFINQYASKRTGAYEVAFCHHFFQ